MSTRAVYDFIDNGKWANKSVSIYKHHDGYPTGGLGFIFNATKIHVPSGDEFTNYRDDTNIRDRLVVGFFVNNVQSGMMEITRGHEFHGDLEYRYEIIGGNKNHFDHKVKIYKRDYYSDGIEWVCSFDGTLQDACKEFFEFEKDPYYQYENRLTRGIA